MKILFTGASSFSGMWFVKELAQAGHTITTTFTQPLENYSGIRRQRIEHLLNICQPVFSCSFGDEKFLKTIASSDWDLFCHHAADTTNYKSPEFDFKKAIENNTHNLNQVLQQLKDCKCKKVLLTGTVFEPDEGEGSDDLPPVSPYGLSKGVTADMFETFTREMNIDYAKFVIPNPFGPFEEFKFTSFLASEWLQGKKAVVTMPDYVRDNIHVSLLAKAYCAYAEGTTLAPYNPSGYISTQGEFTKRFANEMRKRLNVPCEFTLQIQTEFAEPKVRVNTDPVDGDALGWNETQAWDDLANYYKETFSMVKQ